MERARELGRNLLSMARGGSLEEDKEANASKRRSWSDVVSNSPLSNESPPSKTNTEARKGAGKPKQACLPEKRHGSSPGRDSSSQKIFSADDVAKLIEIARMQLRREKEVTSGWKEVEAKDSRSKEKTYARALVDGYSGSPESQFKCWQCDQPGHKSSECPKGERCFVCNSQGHKRAECPVKRKLTRMEKGKALDIGGEAPRQRKAGGIHIGERWPVMGSKPVEHDSKLQGQVEQKKTEVRLETQEWRKVEKPRSTSVHRPGRQNEAGEAGSNLQRPGRQPVLQTQIDTGKTQQNVSK